MTQPLAIALLCYDGVQTLDLAGTARFLAVRLEPLTRDWRGCAIPPNALSLVKN